MFLPYRAKNPPESFPYVTLGLIATNTLVYALTSEYFLSVRRGVLEDFAVSHAQFTPERIFTALFLHGDLFHLFGNMLFLWLFGSSVEGRLRPLKFLAVYFAAGLAGSLLQDFVTGLLAPKMWNLGASGAIMGLAGAYLYMFPYSTVCCFWMYYYRVGVTEWQARWVIGLYVGLDLVQGFFFRGLGIAGGVGHFAHLGGFGAGLALTALLRARRDSLEYADAQAVRADMRGDYSVLSANELEPLMASAQSTANVPLVLAYLKKRLMEHDGRGWPIALGTLRQHEWLLLDRADPDELARVALSLPISAGHLPPVFYLRLGGKAETSGSFDTAALLYRRVYDINPQAPDAETALLRGGRLAEQTNADKAQAAAPYYTEMLRRFPHGPLADQARTALMRLRVPVPAAVPMSALPVGTVSASGDALVFSAGNAAPAGPSPAARADMASVGTGAEQTAPHPAFATPAPAGFGVGGSAQDAAAPDDDLRPVGS